MIVSSLDPLDLIRCAILAPSSHNTQPWTFRVRGMIVELWADRTRALPVNDPDDRELGISCGCALFNLRVAAAQAGLDAVVELLPDGEDRDLLARIAVSPARGPRAEAALYPAIALRRTYRGRFAERPVPGETSSAIAAAGVAEGAHVQLLTRDEDRAALVRLVAEADAVQWANRSWRREVAMWMHPRGRGDGLVLPGIAVPIAKLVVKTLDLGRVVAARNRGLAAASPVLALLGTDGDGVRDHLVAGQALQRLLLTAAQHGVMASFLNQPVQIARLRPSVGRLLQRPGFAQIVLRAGAPERGIAATPRRPVHDVIERE